MVFNNWSLRFLPPFEKKRMKIPVQSSNCRMMNSSWSLAMRVRSSMVLLPVFQIGSIDLDTFGGETSTSIKSAALLPSRNKLCLETEGSNYNTRAGPLFRVAASDGNMDVLKWGEESGYELDYILDEDDIADVALNGHLEVVNYLRKLGISWNKDTCSNAAFSGNLELLKWATRSNQCPWDELTCSNAAINGHLELLKWARTNESMSMG